MSLPDTPIRARALFVLLCVTAGMAVPARAQKPAPPTDLDAFMEKVLARREVNRTTLNQYVLDEREMFEILGPGKAPMHRTKRDFTWYVRDGMHVRSPVRMNGVPVGEAERDEYEQKWIRREKARLERKAKKEKEPATTTGDIVMNPEPRFVSEAYFMDFKFEPGNYYLAGREQLEGHDVLRIEYYPTRLFSDDEHEHGERTREQPKRTTKEQDIERDMNRKMNKTALVTLWVDPAEYQIVKYTFENVWLDFLPGAWLVRVDDLRASMTMGQPFPGVWLPRDIDIHAGFTLANGSFEAKYARDFSEYREAQVKSTIRVPKKLAETVERPSDQAEGSGPFVSGDAERDARRGRDTQAEVIREVRVHGNAFLTDDEVLAIAAVTVGDPITTGTLEAITTRLNDSGRFESVDVRKRYRSIDDPTDVALVLVVHEKPGVRSATQAGGTWSPVRRMTSRLMFLPILDYDDGYGFTYGARISTVDLLGFGERLSVPGTWGGTKRIALEFERPFKSGPLTRVTSSIALWNRDNPYYEHIDSTDLLEHDEQRVEFTAGAERQFGRVFRAAVQGTRSAVDFLGIEDQLWTIGLNAAIDTRIDPAYPSNAVYLGGGWTAVNYKGAVAPALLLDGTAATTGGYSRVNRYTADARGYLRVGGQAVAAARVQYSTGDAPLPAYEQWLLGGSPTVRGFHPGEFIGDEMLVTGTELRVPITSVLNTAKFGLTVFFDAGKTVYHGLELADAPWKKGTGAGIFIIAPLVRINLDVAHGFDAGTRLHLTTGFLF